MDQPVPHPVLLNTWKHHAGWVRYRIARAVAAGPDGVTALPAEMLVVGTRLMDLYTGAFTPAAVADLVLDRLGGVGRFDYPALAAWLDLRGGYAVLDLPDVSRWAVRLGPEGGRYVHLHPGRWSPHTVRVQANTLKSAVMAVAHARLTGRDPLDPAVVNAARRQYLGMLPVREVAAGAGLGAVVRLLAG
ncbi:MAG: hypothetical protein K2X82_26960 [Gemmataceae bacterium]|nr:hypothetical protein [Gemmataceae bacterium]